MNTSSIAAHRFGFSETSLRPLQDDPRGWVLAQFRNPAAFDDRGLLGSAEIGPLTRRVLQAALTNNAAAALAPMASEMAASAAMATSPESPARRRYLNPAAGNGATSGATGGAAGDRVSGAAGKAIDGSAKADRAAKVDAANPNVALNPDRQALRRANLDALQRRWQQVVTTPTPVYERWVMFWSNHFSVAATKGTMIGLVGPYEREAIRPHVTGSFRELLKAATLHPGMLLYLDNAQSIGPDSRAGQRRNRGLNENLGRELLELHTVGVHGGYTQTDVTELAKLLTGWTISRDGGMHVQFNPALHEPGGKTVLGRSYAEGPQAIEALFDDLSRRPATARFVAAKLTRHFVTDDPPPALVDAVAARFLATDGNLAEVAATLFSHDLAWQTAAPPKFKRPEELVLSAHRMLKLPMLRADRTYQALVEMGQAVGRAPSPQGWPDRNEDWLAPDALWKRVQWAAALADQHADMADARQLAALSFGDDLGAETRNQIERADSGRQALALLLASPEFQRR